MIVFLAAPVRISESQNSRVVTLNEAKRLAWLNNWMGAAQVLTHVAASTPTSDDEETRIFSKAVFIRGNIEKMPLPKAAEEITAMISAPGAQNDPELRIELLAIRGDIEFQYDLAGAQETWNAVRELAARHGYRNWMARANGELGTIAFLNGKIFTAIKLVSGALLKAELAGDVAAEIRYRTAMGEGLAEFGRTADAIRFFNKALELAASTPGAYFPFTAYLGKARLLAISGSPVGFRMLEDGLADARRLGLQVRQARILTALGQIATASGKINEAVGWLSEAADVAQRAGLDRIEADASSALAALLLGADEIEQAEDYARRSVTAAERARDLYHLPQLIAVLASIEERNGNFAKAELDYDRATDLVDGLLRAFPEPKAENTLVATMGRVFRGHFELAVNKLHNIPKAFSILESARARGLLDLLRGTVAGHHSLTWSDSASRAIATVQRGLSRETDAKHRRMLLDQLWELEVRGVPLNVPARDFRSWHGPGPVSVQELQSHLVDGDLVVEYALGSPHSYVLAIARDRVEAFQLPAREEVESAASEAYRAMREGHDCRAQSKALYRMLLEPVSLLNQSKRIVIVPDGQLNLTAFDALIDPADRYVIEDHIISYAPSATVYALLSTEERKQQARSRILAVGGARYDPSSAGILVSMVRGAGLFDLSGPPRWAAIPDALAEVTDLAAMEPGRTLLLTRESASEAEIKRLPLSQFQVLHFAVHSSIDEEFPDRSALVLSANVYDGEDGLLQAREIVGFDLNADLVTLSACDAGAGKIEGIAGVNSLVQSFLMAGSRSVVASIWPADDKFTAALMRRFYENLWRGVDKGTALTLAKRELLRIYGPNAVPFYWAGFRLVGDAHGTLRGNQDD